MVDVTKWDKILQIITLFMPVIDWVITKIESLFKGTKTGEEKKAIVLKALKTTGLDPQTLGVVVDTMVETKNATGEFTHSVVLDAGPGLTGEITPTPGNVIKKGT